MQKIKDDLNSSWINLQPIWKQIQEVYDAVYRKAYSLAPGQDLATKFPGVNLYSMNQPQRNVVAERLGEQAGMEAVTMWKWDAEERLFKFQGPLWAFGEDWIKWSINNPLEREHLYVREPMRLYNESDVVRTAAMYLVQKGEASKSRISPSTSDPPC